MCKCRSHGTFPLFGLQSSHLNICYYHQDLHRRPLHPGSRPGFYGDRRALLLIGAWPLPRRPGIGHALKRHPFSGLVDSADSLVCVSRRVGWGARRPTPGARWCRSTPRRRVLGSTIEATTSPRAYLSRLHDRVFKSSAKDSTRRSVEITLQGGTRDLSDARAAPTTRALGGHRPLLRVGNRATGACVASSPDSDLEAFNHNPAHGSFAPLAFQPSAMTNCANQRFLSY
ncbi:hypothetical protein V6N13_022666 [Hibiscus sabdariffa]